MPGGGRRKGCVASPVSPISHNLLNFLWINPFSFPGVSKHSFLTAGGFLSTELLSGITKCYVLFYGLNYAPVEFKLLLFSLTFRVSEAGFPALIQITGISLYIGCKSLCIHNPSL